MKTMLTNFNLFILNTFKFLGCKVIYIVLNFL